MQRQPGQDRTLSDGTLTVDGGVYCLDAYDSQTADGTKVDPVDLQRQRH